MDKLFWLDKIKLLDRAKVGDKAFYLSKIMQRGYPVVPGFVVSAEVLRQFLETLNSSESLIADLPYSSLHLDVANWRQLQQVAGRLRQAVTMANIPQDWVKTIYQAATLWQKHCLILRPSLGVPVIQGTGNISGLLETVFCHCNEEAIAQGLKSVWSQLFRAKSLLYWQNLGIDLQQINLGVLVQPVENAIASGVFNASPLTWEIESTYGLGVAITNGEILPDVYYIQPETDLLVEQQLGNKPLAYYVSNDINNILQVQILDETQQQQYSLPQEYLEKIIALGNQMVGELGSKLTFKWTITQSPVPQLYITQVSTPHAIIPSFSLLKGIGAARGRVIGKAHIIINSQHKPEYIPKGVILVAPVITPDWLPLLQEVAGIVTEQGGLTSHAAILARELGIPSVVSVSDATSMIQNGEKLLLDGDRGEVYLLKGDSKEAVSTDIITEAKIEIENRATTPSPITPVSTSPLPMIATQLLVNISQPSLIEQVQNLPVDGVGLLRSELMILTILEGQHPQNWLLAGKEAELLERWTEQIIKFTRAFAPRHVLYRSLDWRSSDLPSLSEDYKSSVLGDRGVINYIRYPAIFELELQALARVQKSGYKNLQLLLPFVRTVEEFKFCRQKVEQAGLTQVSQFQLWMMAEVPSVLFLLPEYIQAGVAGISIGTNDLAQLLLGIDREQGDLAENYDERHPAVMKAIAQIIKMAQAGGIPCSICGQAPALYPEIIDQLVEWGITSISVEPEAVERTHRAIARAEQRIILAAARRQLEC